MSSRGRTWFILEVIYELLAGYFSPGPQMISITLLFSLDSSAICELKDVPGNSNDWIVLQEMHLGCWTDFTTRDGAEVHILSLLSSNVSWLWDHCVFLVCTNQLLDRPAQASVQWFSAALVQAGLVLADQITLWHFSILNTEIIYLSVNWKIL